MKPYYEEAGITIYHGDCREVLPTLGPVDLVLTDPPYEVHAGHGGGAFGGRDSLVLGIIYLTPVRELCTIESWKTLANHPPAPTAA